MIPIKIISVDPMRLEVSNPASDQDAVYRIALPPLKVKLLDIPLADASIQGEGDLLGQTIEFVEPKTVGEVIDWLFEHQEKYKRFVEEAQRTLMSKPLLG